MTKKLFYENPYLKSFTATVTGCAKGKEGWLITLDQTAFYPEGGGQPGDNGTLGNVRVLDVHEKDGQILHTVDGPLEPGTIVSGELDWELRLSRMQHHTGEHIVSGILHQRYGCDNVGFHMGHDAVTIDLSLDLSAQDLAEAERLANEAIRANLSVTVAYPNKEALSTLEYRSKKELSENVRIITVPGCDVCACCGLHVAKTGEVGLVKLLNAQRYKGGTRVWLLCAGRAMEDYAQKNKDIYAVSALLSAKPHEIVSAVSRLLEERDGLKGELAALQEQFFAMKAASIPAGSHTVQFEQSLSPTELRRYCLALSHRCTLAVVLSGKDDTWKYALASNSTDVRPLGNDLNKTFSGKGGGKKELVQGSLSGAQEEIERFFKSKLE